ncbi:UNVERIFIED_CONTAM: hypothetical protein PYX00_000373 [Menopon gallinae]|uniref:CCDC113/CCDC96 coiled-coil domain-containing protein n=1 Tax=Menopon gallinae TaxID=328185 RepID=A0AAW2I8A6_9NEOP
MSDKDIPGVDLDDESLSDLAGESDSESTASSNISRKSEAGDEKAKRKYLWKVGEGEEYGEGEPLHVVIPEGEGEYPYPIWDEPPTVSTESVVSIASTITEIEETEEERLARAERERLIDIVRLKLIARTSLRRKNIFLHRKLAEHIKKRRLDHAAKEDPKVQYELTAKYLKRLYHFNEFKESQDGEMRDLAINLRMLKNDTERLEEELKETMDNFMENLKELSTTLVSSRTGKRLNEKMVHRLLKRLTVRNVEKGELRLKYVKMRNKIEEKERELKTMENFGNGLYIMDYEQLKIDNQNYSDKIEEKEEELTKLRVKTQCNIQNLAQVREKAYAIEGDIEITEAKYGDIEAEFNNVGSRPVLIADHAPVYA